MGELNNFHINDDGSVTVEQQLSEQEKNILDIFKIEKSKGGVFASYLMKKRAMKYAKSVNYPEFKVDKLMLDSYPDNFANYPKTTALIIWFFITLICLGGALSFVFIHDMLLSLLGVLGCATLTFLASKQCIRLIRVISQKQNAVKQQE